MARRGTGSMVGGSGGMIQPVISIATGLLIFVILQIFAPTIAGTIEESQPASYAVETCGVGGVFSLDSANWTYQACTGDPNENVTVHSDWNGTYNTDLPDGVDTWTTNVRILGVVILIISIAIAMYYLKGM